MPAASLLEIAPAIWGFILVIVPALGVASALHALMRVRTSQGTAAWCIALVTFPWVAVPLYWIFGSSRFFNYVDTLRNALDANIQLAIEFTEAMKPHHGSFTRESHPCEYALDILTWRRFTNGNSVDLLIDGPATFEAIFRAIDNSREYLLIQFFIIRDDEIGRQLQQKLIARSRAGVRVHLLFDEIGSHRLDSNFLADLRAAGVEIFGFGTASGRINPFQINFRNHRKIVIADGAVAFVGGHNIGDEYLGKSRKFGRWRDTHLRIEGPAVQGIQTVFLEDWYWAARSVPTLQWHPRTSARASVHVLPLETGPIDRLEACTLMFHHLIGSARERLWIASPYFVPDDGVGDALKLAALRGVDVRILIPSTPDKRLVYLAAFSYLEEMCDAGVKIYRYEDGFLHQKVVLVDDFLSVVGTANLDNRSLRLNFELSIVVSDKSFAKEVAAMLENDFARSRKVDGSDYASRPLAFRYAVRFCRLLAPVL